jgi:hypothetical protein
VVELVPGIAPAARWQFDVVVREHELGIDFGGPFVHGKRDDRHIGLAWGELVDDRFELFRGAKLRLDPSTRSCSTMRHGSAAPRRATAAHGRKRQSRRASVRPPDTSWSTETA